MTRKTLSAGILALALVGCGDGGPRYLVETPPSTLRVYAAVKTVLVRTVSLPTYAADEEIWVQDPSGTVRAGDFGLWADEPERATTLAVTRQLNMMTSAKVAPEPWPLPAPPEGVVDIRIETFLATNRRTFEITGQYFIGSEVPEVQQDFSDPDAEPVTPPPPIPDRVGVFDISVPIRASGPQAIADAQAAALTQLSERIARDLAR